MVHDLNFRWVAGRPNKEYFVAVTPGRRWDEYIKIAHDINKHSVTIVLTFDTTLHKCLS
jgi:hypothetical protein